MNTYSRAGFKWTINETLSLQREFELLGWDIEQIATKHKRSPHAIMFKLDSEGLADYNVLYSNYYHLNSTTPVSRSKTTTKTNTTTSTADLRSEFVDDFISVVSEDDDDDDDEEYLCDESDDDDDDEYFCDESDEYDNELANISQRVERLEESVSVIKNMMNNMMNNMITSFTSNGQTPSKTTYSVGCFS